MRLERVPRLGNLGWALYLIGVCAAYDRTLREERERISSDLRHHLITHRQAREVMNRLYQPVRLAVADVLRIVPSPVFFVVKE